MPDRFIRLKLTIAYDGAAFKGWQSQPFKQTVQDVMEDALLRIAGHRIVVHASGRTDTGVHAIAQCAHIDVPDRLAVAEWHRILNHNLPPAIRVMRCREVPRAFHAQRSAKGKIYRYLIRNEDIVTPHEVDRVWLIPGELDEKKLRAAAAVFVGHHHFGGFTVNKNNPGQEERTITAIRVAKKGTLISITFEGEGFLYHMVRMLVGAIVRVAQGHDELSKLKHRLRRPTTPRWTEVAPARGLYLVKVLY